MAKTQIVHISLGFDCAVRYQLEACQLSQLSYPFDWVKSNNIDTLCDCIDKEFSIFFEGYTTKLQSNNFDNFDTIDVSTDKNIKSKIQLKLCNGLILPHEAIDDVFDESIYKEKYKRRIDRFKNIVQNKEIKKIFIRADEKSLTEIQKDKLKKSLDLYGCINYEIKFICYADYKCTEKFTWQRDYICWKELFF